MLFPEFCRFEQTYIGAEELRRFHRIAADLIDSAPRRRDVVLGREIDSAIGRREMPRVDDVTGGNPAGNFARLGSGRRWFALESLFFPGLPT
ncbi:MAG: hypothetical protein JWL90_1900 [Chthoniobacteraceae bacterium]|nr:hypothetical protein [Chthoniobacteraceae bacterium]